MNTYIKMVGAIALGIPLYVKMPSADALKKRLEQAGYTQLVQRTAVHKTLGHQLLRVETLECIVDHAQAVFKESWQDGEKERDKDAIMHIVLRDSPQAMVYWQTRLK